MSLNLRTRLAHAWNAFTSRDPTQYIITGPGCSSRPDRPRLSRGNEKSIATSIFNRIVSLSKWERKWHKPFFSKRDKTLPEIIDYIKCMTITKNVPSEVYDRISKSQTLIDQISAYIDDPMTATTWQMNLLMVVLVKDIMSSDF